MKIFLLGFGSAVVLIVGFAWFCLRRIAKEIVKKEEKFFED